MANDVSIFNIDKLAERAQTYLAKNGLSFTKFSTNIGGGVKEKGETVKTRLAGSLVAQDKSGGKIESQDANLTAVTVTLNKVAAVKIGFSDLERSYTGLALDQEFIIPAFEALNQKIMTDTLGLATAANGFDTSEKSVAIADFSADTMANIARVLSENKVPHSGRTGVFSPAIIESLVTDGAIQNASSFGDSNAVKEGKVARVHGIDTFEYTGDIPTNGEAMTGIVAHPAAFAIATRSLAEPQSGTWAGQVRSVVDATTGLPFQIRSYYDQEAEEQVIEWNILYGVATGQAKAAVRIVEPA